MSLFDGVTTLLSDVFGAMVQHENEAGEAAEIQAVFRKEPISITDDDGRNILILAPVLHVPKPYAEKIKTGDIIKPSEDEVYRIINSTPLNNNASSDAFILFDLEEISEEVNGEELQDDAESQDT